LTIFYVRLIQTWPPLKEMLRFVYIYGDNVRRWLCLWNITPSHVVLWLYMYICTGYYSVSVTRSTSTHVMYIRRRNHLES